MNSIDIQNLAKKLLSEGRIVKANTIIGLKSDEYLSSRSRIYRTYVVERNNQLFWITQVNADITSIYDLLKEKEVTTL
mgnify:FL=1|jgi:hypothetical protein|nr:MAG TPA: hypothetical protein [Caudoviricetes sp.]